MADIQIDGASQLGFRHLQFASTVQTNSTTFYQFYLSNTTDLVYRKSVDGALTWGSEVTVATDASEVITKAVFWYDRWTDGIGGNLIHIFYIARAPAGGTTARIYRNLDVSTDTLGSEVTIGSGAVDPSTNWDVSCISIVKTRSGNLYAGGWVDTGGGGDNFLVKSTDNGVTWNAKATMADGGAVDKIIFLPANLADKDDFWCVYGDVSAPELTVKTYDASADSWSESGTFTGGFTTNSTIHFQIAAAIRWSDGHAIIVIWNAVGSSTADYKAFDFDGTTGTALTDILTNQDESGGSSITINQANDDLRCGYLLGGTWQASVDVKYKVSTDGGTTWTDKAYSEDTADDIKWLSCDPSPPSDGGFLLVWRNDDLADILTNIVNQVQPLGGASNGLSGAAGKHQIQILADWSGDGDFLDANEDITADIRSIRVEHFRDYITDYMEARRLSLVLNNSDHKYSPPRGTISGLASGVELWVRAWYPYDTFSDTDATDLDAHTPDFDANWVWVHAVDARAFHIDNSDGAAKTDGGGAGNYFADFEFDDKDVSFSTNMSVHNTGGDPGLLFRFVDTSNYLFVRCLVGSSNNIEIRKVISGSETSEATGSFTWNDGETHFLQVALHGTSIRIFIDKSEVIDVTFTNAAVDNGTRHGLHCTGPSTPARWFDFGGFKSLFFGRITSIVPIPDAQDQRCIIEAIDEFEQFQRIKLQFANTLQTSAQRSDQIMGELLTAGGFSTGRRQLESATTLLNDVDEGLKAVSDDLLTALQRLQDEEDGLVLMDDLGYAILEKRDHRGAAPHTVSKGTVSDVNTVTRVGFSHLEWDDGNEGVENLMVARTKRATKDAEAVVWEHPEAATSPVSTLSFSAAETQNFVAETDKDSADAWEAPKSGSDGLKNAITADESGTGWANETNVFASDDARAVYSGTGQEFLRVKNFTFAVPTGAVIIGIEVSIEGNGDSATGSERVISVDITKDGTAGVGTPKTLTLPQTTDSVQVLGSTTDLWGTTYTVADVNATTFGVRIQKNDSVSVGINLDHVQMRIYYHLDYIANTSSDGTGTDITSELTVTLVDTDAYAGKHQKVRVLFGSNAGFLTRFRLRADARTKDNDPSDAHVEDTTSITSFGERRLEIDCQYIDRDPVARAMITNRLARRKDSKTQLRVVMPMSTKIGMHQVIQRRISDRITAIYADMGINEAFFLEGWEWETSVGGTVVVVTWLLRGV